LCPPVGQYLEGLDVTLAGCIHPICQTGCGET
jgi:hypothetical protein